VSATLSGHNGWAPLPTWAELEPAVPAMVATMRHLLTQAGCILRPAA
jgi:hypothetical protein